MSSEIKSLLKHSTVYSLGNLLGKVVSFIMLPVYTHVLTPSDYGVLELLTLTSTVIAMLISLKLTSAMPRIYYEHRDPARKNSVISTSVLFSVAASVVVVAGLYLVRGSISGLVFGTRGYSGYFGYVFATMAFEILCTVGYTYLRILEKSMLYVWFSMLQLVLGLSLNVVFLVVMKMGVLGALLSMLLSGFITTLILLAFVFRRVGFRFDREQFLHLAKFSLPLVPAAVATFVLNMGDRFILNHMTDTAGVGVYSLGYKFGILLGTFVGGPFLAAWEPKRFDIYENNPDAKRIFEKVFVYAVLALVAGGLCICVLIEEIVGLMAAPEYSDAARITPWVILGYVFFTAFYVVDIGFLVRKKTSWYLYINTMAAAIKVGLTFLLVDWMGVVGAAVATMAAFCFQACSGYWVSQKYFPLDYDFMKILKLAVPAMAIYFASVWVDTGHMALDLFLKMGLLVLYPLCLLMLGIFEKNEIAFLSDTLKIRWGQVRGVFGRSGGI